MSGSAAAVKRPAPRPPGHAAPISSSSSTSAEWAAAQSGNGWAAGLNGTLRRQKQRNRIQAAVTVEPTTQAANSGLNGLHVNGDGRY